MLKLFFTNDQSNSIDIEIDAVSAKMQEVGVTDEKYPELLKHLKKLNEMKTQTRRPPVSKDTVIMALTNLAGILVIVAYEQKHVFTSKGVNQLIRLKGQK